jgi:hypothetical protein
MNDRQRRFLWLGITLAVLLGIAWDHYPLPDARERLDRLPMRGPNFAGEDVPLTPSEAAVFGDARVVHRRYEFDGDEVFLTLVDGTGNRHAVHDPRYCFIGAGWEIVSETALPTSIGQIRCFKAKQSSENLEAVFWFSNGRRCHSSFPRYWWQTTTRRLTLGRSGPEPLMVVLQCFERPPDWPKLIGQITAKLGL